MTAASKIRPLGGSRNLCNLFVQLEFKGGEEEGGGREEERDRQKQRKETETEEGKEGGKQENTNSNIWVGKGHRSGV